MKNKLFTFLLSGLVFSAPLIAFKPQNAQAEDANGSGYSCTPYTGFASFNTPNNPSQYKVLTLNIHDNNIHTNSNVVASVSETTQGHQFLGGAVFSVLDVAPESDKVLRVRVRLDTNITSRPLHYDVVYLACNPG